MKKIYLILLFLLSSLSGFSNGENDSTIWLKVKNGKIYLFKPAEGWGEVTNYPDRWLVAKKGNETALIYRGGFKGTLYLPNNSGSTPTLNGGRDSTGAIWVKRSNGKMYIYLKGYGWKQYATLSEVDSMISAGGGGSVPTLWQVTHKGDSTNENIKAAGFTINAANKFINTGGNYGFGVRTNNVQAIYIDTMPGGGRVGIGMVPSPSIPKLLQVNSDALINNVTIGLGGGSLSGNTALGDAALTSHSSGTGNTAVGKYALTSNTSGAENTAVGYYAGGNGDGDYNTFVGYQAALNISGAIENTAVGHKSMQQMTNAEGNVAVGIESLQLNETGDVNTAIGTLSLQNNTADSNTAVGYSSLNKNTTAKGNTAVGAAALYAQTSGGVANSAFGNKALTKNTTADSGVALGFYALKNVTTGGNNTAVGSMTGLTLTTGSNNILIGHNTDVSASSTSNFLNIGRMIYGTGFGNSTGKVGVRYSNPLYGFSVNAKVGLNKDSITVSSGQEWYLSLDTTTTPNQVKRQKVTSGSTYTAGNGIIVSGTTILKDSTKGWSTYGNVVQNGMSFGSTNAKSIRIITNGVYRGMFDSGGVFKWGGTAASPNFSVATSGLTTALSLTASSSARTAVFFPNSGAGVCWNNNFTIKSPSAGVLTLTNEGETDLNRIQGGGTSSAFPSWKRSGTNWEARLADDSGPTTVGLKSLNVNVAALGTITSGLVENDSSLYATNSSLNRFALGGKINDLVSPVSNSGTSETDLYTYTTKANTLSKPGEDLVMNLSGLFNDVTSTANLKFYFGGTVIANTGALTISTMGGWVATIRIKRTGANSAECSVNLSTPGASTAVYTSQIGLGAITFTNTNIIKVTGIAGGATPTTGDIQAIFGDVQWWGAANN